MNLDLSGKRAVVTGASLGIGEATVKLLAQHGADVFFCARTDEAVTNIIKHSYKEENKKNIIEVELEFLENKVIIHLYDNGTPVNEEKIKPRELSDVKPGGLGTYFINKIMDEVRWKKSDKWVNHLTLIKNINI